MYELKGKYGVAAVHSQTADKVSVDQIKEMLDCEWSKDLSIKIMPDYHAGKGCVIGTTIQLDGYVVPNLVGVDIGCGMVTTELGSKRIEFSELDRFIKSAIPTGQNVNAQLTEWDRLDDLKCLAKINKDRVLRSIGTLGGGNHFIEIDRDKSYKQYLIVHSGSRYLGVQVAKYYQALAEKKGQSFSIELENSIEKGIADLKAAGEQGKISNFIKESKDNYPQSNIPKALMGLTGQDMEDYLNDMKIAQEYAILNRDTIVNKILAFLNIGENNSFHTIHNYISTNEREETILRKGAISAEKYEKVLIPINMRDGCIIGIGRGNKDYNYSAPHGAGRLFSRTQAKNNFSLEEFEETMKGVYSTSVNHSTLDESPMAYKSLEEILPNLEETIKVVEIIKPVYNFKHSEEIEEVEEIDDSTAEKQTQEKLKSMLEEYKRMANEALINRPMPVFQKCDSCGFLVVQEDLMDRICSDCRG